MSQHEGNILDPIHSALDPRVFDDPAAPEPQLRPELQEWITRTTAEVFERYGYTKPEEWLTGVFTGSLTTFQYSDASDCDLNLFVDAKRLPDWSRAEMSAIAVNNLDPLKLPGTPYQMQVFVQPPDITIEDHFRPGLHAGFIVFGKNAGTWASPPDRENVHDVEKDMNASYLAGLLSCDKMDLLMRYEPDEATKYWHDLHNKRREDMQHDLGDYATSNIIWKMLSNRGLDPTQRTAKLASDVPDYIPEEWEPEQDPGMVPQDLITKYLSQLPHDKAEAQAESMARKAIEAQKTRDGNDLIDEKGNDWTDFMVHMKKVHLLGQCHRCGGSHKVVPRTGTLFAGGKPGTIGGLPANLCAYCRGDEERPPKPRELTKLQEAEFGHSVVWDTTSPGVALVEDQRQHSDYDPCATCGLGRSEHRYAEYEKQQLAENSRQFAEQNGHPYDPATEDWSEWMPSAFNRDAIRNHPGDMLDELRQRGIRYHPYQDSGQRTDPYTGRYRFDRPSLNQAIANGGGRFNTDTGNDWELNPLEGGIYHFQPVSDYNGRRNPYADPGFKVPAADVHTALGLDRA